MSVLPRALGARVMGFVAPSRYPRRLAMRVLALVSLLVVLSVPDSATSTFSAPNGQNGLDQFCQRLSDAAQNPSGRIAASSGAQLFCAAMGRHGVGGDRGQNSSQGGPTGQQPGANDSATPRNVDAANPREDITPALVQTYGQSEVSTAASGSYAVEAWNDATGFFSPCGSPMYKEELTGYGFSSDGGRSFTDLGGLPNDACASGFRYFGDPSVETVQRGGQTYFYISSLYLNGTTGQSDIAMDACQVTGNGAAATLTCTSTPTIIAAGTAGDFLDKDFFSIDPQRARLYNSYTRFCGNLTCPYFQGQIELATCDISTPLQPVCFPGASQTPYLIVQPADANCEHEGAYPAVDVASGDVYVAWEFNWATNLGPPFGPPQCQGVPTQNRVAYVPFACLTLTPVSPCATAPRQQAVPIVSLDAAFVPGYNRTPTSTSAPLNDFPRIAVSDRYGTVSIVWNDARCHPWGDVLLQSFNLVTLTPVQAHPAPVNQGIENGANQDGATQSGNNDHNAGQCLALPRSSPEPAGQPTPYLALTSAWHILPALRQADHNGLLSVSYYQRPIPNTDTTDVYATLGINPRTGASPDMAGQAGQIVKVTSLPSAWSDVSSDIMPNFGDYTDNYVLQIPAPPYYNQTLYVAWSDGRLGLPQPFEARLDRQ